MKKLLIPALTFTGALFLYNCTGDDAALLNPENSALDSLQSGDTIAIDSTIIDSVYVPVDSIYFPGDSTVIDTIAVPTPITFPYPYPNTGNDSLDIPVDSLQ